MTVLDILTRVDAICKKYECYDIDDLNNCNVTDDDTFAPIYAIVESNTDSAFENAELVPQEKDIAALVALNAEIVRAKSRLLKQVPALQNLAKEKVEGLSFEEFSARIALVQALLEKIKAIPHHGVSAVKKASRKWASTLLQIDGLDSDGRFHGEYFDESAKSRQFSQDDDMRKLKQD